QFVFHFFEPFEQSLKIGVIVKRGLGHHHPQPPAWRDSSIAERRANANAFRPALRRRHVRRLVLARPASGMMGTWKRFPYFRWARPCSPMGCFPCAFLKCAISI